MSSEIALLEKLRDLGGLPEWRLRGLDAPSLSVDDLAALDQRGWIECSLWHQDRAGEPRTSDEWFSPHTSSTHGNWNDIVKVGADEPELAPSLRVTDLGRQAIISFKATALDRLKEQLDTFMLAVVEKNEYGPAHLGHTVVVDAIEHLRAMGLVPEADQLQHRYKLLGEARRALRFQALPIGGVKPLVNYSPLATFAAPMRDVIDRASISGNRTQGLPIWDRLHVSESGDHVELDGQRYELRSPHDAAFLRLLVTAKGGSVSATRIEKVCAEKAARIFTRLPEAIRTHMRRPPGRGSRLGYGFL